MTTATYTFDESVISDLHKDAYGYRPGSIFWVNWGRMTPAEKQAEWDFLCAELEESDKRERRAQGLAAVKWDSHISGLMETFGISRGDAVRWDMESMDAVGDADYYCFKWGMSYHMEAEINQCLEDK